MVSGVAFWLAQYSTTPSRATVNTCPIPVHLWVSQYMLNDVLYNTRGTHMGVRPLCVLETNWNQRNINIFNCLKYKDLYFISYSTEKYFLSYCSSKHREFFDPAREGSVVNDIDVLTMQEVNSSFIIAK